MDRRTRQNEHKPENGRDELVSVRSERIPYQLAANRDEQNRCYPKDCASGLSPHLAPVPLTCPRLQPTAKHEKGLREYPQP
jgi:hypothetical protein